MADQHIYMSDHPDIKPINPIRKGRKPIENVEAYAAACARNAKMKERMELLHDHGYYTTICFQTKEQMETFMRAMGFEQDGSCGFIDGMKLAKRKGIKLPEVPPGALESIFGTKRPAKGFDLDQVESFFDETQPQ